MIISQLKPQEGHFPSKQLFPITLERNGLIWAKKGQWNNPYVVAYFSHIKQKKGPGFLGWVLLRGINNEKAELFIKPNGSWRLLGVGIKEEYFKNELREQLIWKIQRKTEYLKTKLRYAKFFNKTT